jgi:hypothetical protein
MPLIHDLRWHPDRRVRVTSLFKTKIPARIRERRHHHADQLPPCPPPFPELEWTTAGSPLPPQCDDDDDERRRQGGPTPRRGGAEVGRERERERPRERKRTNKKNWGWEKATPATPLPNPRGTQQQQQQQQRRRAPSSGRRSPFPALPLLLLSLPSKWSRILELDWIGLFTDRGISSPPCPRLDPTPPPVVVGGGGGDVRGFAPSIGRSPHLCCLFARSPGRRRLARTRSDPA